MKKRILCFGDSNTWGYIPGTAERYDEDERWTGIVQTMLGDGYQIVEEGMTGRTTVFDTGFDDLLNGKKALGYILKSQLPLSATVVFLGTNDLCDHHMERIELGITEIIRLIRNSNYIYRTKTPVFPDGVKILLVAPLPYGETAQIKDEIKKESHLYGETYKRVADNMGVKFLNPEGIVNASDIDGIHLTKEGHRKMAELIYKALMEMAL